MKKAREQGEGETRRDEARRLDLHEELHQQGKTTKERKSDQLDIQLLEEWAKRERRTHSKSRRVRFRSENVDELDEDGVQQLRSNLVGLLGGGDENGDQTDMGRERESREVSEVHSKRKAVEEGKFTSQHFVEPRRGRRR